MPVYANDGVLCTAWPHACVQVRTVHTESATRLGIIVQVGHVGDGIYAEGIVDVARRHAMLLRKHAQVQHIDFPPLHSESLLDLAA